MKKSSESLSRVKSLLSSSSFSDIARWSRPVHGSIGLICLIGMVTSLLSLAVTLVTKELIDSAVSSNINLLWRFALALIALIVAERLLSVLNSSIRLKASAKLQRHLQGMVTSAILSKEYADLKAYHSGELTNRVFSDAGVVRNGILNLLPSLLRTAVSFIGAAVILISMDWRFVPVMIVVGILGVMITLLFRDPMKRRHKRMQQAEDALHASTQETLENIRVVKSSATEARAVEMMEDRRARLSDEQIRNGRLSILMNQGMGGLFDISWLVCNLWGCFKIYQGTFTYGSLAALIQLVGRIQSPIANAVSLISQAYGVVASAERLQDVIGLPDEPQGTELTAFDEISLENVSFQYDDGADDVLLNVSGTIRQGEFVALTGVSGGGKTSLFQLLLAIYHPTSGRVVFRNGEASVEACRGTRRLFAYVPQGNTLLSGTLRDNLVMFAGNASDPEIMKAADAACIGELVRGIGLNAVLGERGIGLSEGQAQRVAVARALLSDAPVLLLDEATSALDEETEARLLQNISMMRKKTCMIVTHRKAALDICDYEWHIEGGRLKVNQIMRPHHATEETDD